jgi:hypothetical protein
MVVPACIVVRVRDTCLPDLVTGYEAPSSDLVLHLVADLDLSDPELLWHVPERYSGLSQTCPQVRGLVTGATGRRRLAVNILERFVLRWMLWRTGLAARGALHGGWGSTGGGRGFRGRCRS